MAIIDEIMKEYNLNTTTEEDKLKPLDEIVEEVINGEWGYGVERKRKLEEKGYDYNLIQTKINRIVTGTDEIIDKLSILLKGIEEGIIKVDDLKINISIKSKNSGIKHCIKYKGENRRWFK